MSFTIRAATVAPARDARTTRTRSALLVGSVAALVKLATALPILTRYGWDRDELYFLQAAHHLAFGYVDFPPVTALVTRLVIDLFGPALFWLRLTGVIAAIGVTVIIALCVAELGGGVRAQALATGAFVASPWGLGLGMLLHPTMFDALTEAGFAYLALRILIRPEPRLWPALGLIAGIGFETKGTILLLIATFVAGTAVCAPRRLCDRRALLALGIALAVAAPQIAWEIAHDWPTIAFLPSQTAVTAQATPISAYVLQQILFLAGSGTLVLVGVHALWRRRLHVLALLAPAVSLVFLIERGRSYYALPAIVIPLAAGAVAAESWWPTASRRARRLAVALVATLQLAGLGLGAVVVWPVLPTSTMIRLGVWKPSFYDDELGWAALVDDTAHAWDQLPADQRAQTVILAANYGEAGALDLWGPRHGLPTALSGHLSFQYWHPHHMRQRLLLTVGYDPAQLDRLCTDYRIVGHVTNRWHLDNQEQHQPIATCLLPKTLGQIWSRQIATDRL
jgi:4-amino-4-deoxy-L-arabinose transferase-like glycosyltransferase